MISKWNTAETQIEIPMKYTWNSKSDYLYGIFVSLLYHFEGSKAVQWPKPSASSSSPQAISDLISRVLVGAPAAKLFRISINADLAVNGKDTFQLSGGPQPDTILISASTGVAAAWGFNYYLKYVTNSSGRI